MLTGRRLCSLKQTSCSFLNKYSARPARLNTEHLLKDSSSAATKVLLTGATVDRKYLRFRDESSEHNLPDESVSALMPSDRMLDL